MDLRVVVLGHGDQVVWVDTLAISTEVVTLDAVSERLLMPTFIRIAMRRSAAAAAIPVAGAGCGRVPASTLIVNDESVADDAVATPD